MRVVFFEIGGFAIHSYGLIVRFAMEFLRGDSPRYALQWTAGQWTSVSVIGISLMLILYFILRSRKVKPIALIG